MEEKAPPPSYSDTVTDKAPISSSLGRTDAPPAYGDLFPGFQDVRDQVDKARQSEGPAPAPVAVPLTLCNILCKSFFCGCCYLLLAALPVAMIVIGSVYLHDCTLQGRIPVFLIVFGCFSLLQTCCGVGKMFCCRGNDDENDNQNRRKKGGNFCEGLITTFLFIWVIVGSVYTFGAWNTWVDSGRNNCPGTDCCNPVLMYFAFSTLLLMYGISALCLCCFFCCVCCAMAGSAVSSGAG
ncbi:PREDICTED: uncharacterized protein LOC100634411 isoform X3 [Amphimedon queenslandica]|uniref:Uncharacterized protein n=2 Tax=Amphimedon queenslandica TaxID=400682 RepID=A0AAN0II56_AMPQE|nr:PREDICTED: uncharacterized protein LOC100634411 isoform X3 [Amphimedon queenslandica]|eukprot:XP_003389967.1 PREDICTED: uncharacterized protein LOC100634411 isoform X3 [Amphimedon queenslandica]